jgi:hypothetical protein
MVTKKIVRKKKVEVVQEPVEVTAVTPVVVTEHTHTEPKKLPVLLILSLLLNIVFMAILVSWFKTPIFDYLAFNKTLPTMCALTYNNKYAPPMMYNDTFKALCENDLGDNTTVKARLRPICSRNRHSTYYNDLYKETCESKTYWAPENPPVLPD